MKRTPLGMIALAGLVLLFANVVEARQPTHGQADTASASTTGQAGVFDYYLLTLSWSPTYCVTHPNDKPQCGDGKGYGFVLHGLWPQYASRGYPYDCKTDFTLTPAATDFGKTIFPSPKLVGHEWGKHGTCSGLDAMGYFKAADQARTDLKIPAKLESPTTPMSMTSADIIKAFAEANPKMPSNGLVVACSRSELQEVRVCLDKKFSYMECGKSVKSNCGTNPIRVRSVR